MKSYCWFLRLTKPPCIGAAEEEGLVNMRLLLLPFTTTGLHPPSTICCLLVTSNPRLASPKPTHHYLQVLEIALFDLLTVKSRPRNVVLLHFEFKIITQKVLSQIMNLN